MYIVLWIAAFVIFAVAEAITAGLVSIWFAIGALGALITAIAGGGILLQVVVFLVVTAVVLVITRPLAKKLMHNHITHTNADRVLDKVGLVTETIENVADTGRVSVEGKHWKARSETGAVIPEGTRVKGVRIEGVKLFVREEKSAVSAVK